MSGLLIDDILSQIRPFDMIAFRSLDCILHIALIVTSDVLYDPAIRKSRLYLMDTDVGRLTGVMIHDFKQVLRYYHHKHKNIEILWCPLKDDWFLKHPHTHSKLTYLYTELKSNCILPYVIPSCFSVCCYRSLLESTFFNHDNWLNCCELVVVIYKVIGILPSYIDPKQVVPEDLVIRGICENHLPRIIHGNIRIITSPIRRTWVQNWGM